MGRLTSKFGYVPQSMRSKPRSDLGSEKYHWLGAYRTNAVYSGHIFVHFNDLEDVFT